MIRRPPRSTRTDTLFPYTTLFRSVAIVDPAKVGSTLTAIIEITLDVQTAEYLDAFEVSVAHEAAVLQCYRVSPGPDFIIVAPVADMPAYHAMAPRAFTSQANVRNVRSSFSVHRSKFETLLAPYGRERLREKGWKSGV